MLLRRAKPNVSLLGQTVICREYRRALYCLVTCVICCGGSTLVLRGCCRMGESLLNDMAAVSLEDPAEAKEAEMEKAPPLAFGAVVKKQHKWQVPAHSPYTLCIQCFSGRVFSGR